MGCSYVAFEPVQVFRALHNLNNLLNGWTEAVHGILFPYALGSRARLTRMYVPRTGKLGSAKISEHGDVIVQVRRLDELFHSPKKVCGAKLDVEGGEPVAMEGFGEILGSTPYILLEFSPIHAKNTSLFDNMLRHFYEMQFHAYEIPWRMEKSTENLRT